METEALARASQQHRGYLTGLAYRMLGEVGEAEDVVQEALLRYREVLQRGEVARSERALLTTITTRLCLDHLRSARVRRERYTGPWLPEPVVAEYVDPLDELAGTESMSSAFLVLLERLSPEQRAVFLLHEVFGYEYAEIAGFVDKSPTACRQIGVRARRHLDTARYRFTGSREEADALAGSFMAACRDGDLAGLLGLLLPQARFVGDGGDSGRGFRRPIEGAEQVARALVGTWRRLLAEGFDMGLVHVGTAPAVRLLDPDGGLFGIWSLVLDGDRVAAIHGAVNPDKLGHLGVPVSPLRFDR